MSSSLAIPAFAQNRSIVSNFVYTALIKFFISSLSPTSTLYEGKLDPSFCSSKTRSPIITFLASRLRSSFAIAFPIPRDPPVTTQIFPLGLKPSGVAVIFVLFIKCSISLINKIL